MFTGVRPKSRDFLLKKAGPGKTQQNNILVETTKAFAAHVIGVTVSPNGYTHKDGRQTLETCKFVTCHMSHVTNT